MVADGYKQTDVGVIPEDWDTKALSESFKFKNGLNKAKEFFGHGTPIVNYMDVYNNYGLKENNIVGKVEVTSDEQRNYHVKKGDVFFTRTSETVDEIGLSTVVVDDVNNTVFSGFILRARPIDNKYNLAFKKYCFSSKIIRTQIMATSSYTTRALTNGTLLGKIIVPIPPKPEQQAIATALSDTDELINSLEKLISKKEAIKTGTMQELLTGKKRLDGFNGEWEEKNLNEICDVRDGTHDSPKYKESGVKFVTSKNIIDAKLDFTDIKFISKEDSIEIDKRSKVNKGDIIMSMIGTIGNAVLINDEPDFSIKNVALFKPITSKVNPIFFIQMLHSEFYQGYIESKLAGGIQKFISLGVLRTLSMPIPKLDEQNIIATILSDMDNDIDALKTKLSKVKAIKEGMMQELLTGRTRLV